MKRDVPHFRIGLLLTEAGIIAPGQLDAAIQRGEGQGSPFLRVLVESGDLTQHELQAVIRAQSLIWSGHLDVERAIEALSVVHSSDVSIDEGLRSVGWTRPANQPTNAATNAATIAQSVRVNTKPTEPPLQGTPCQYCASPMDAGSLVCSFCTGENQKTSPVKVQIEPAWQRQASVTEGRILATNPARDPFLMAMLSGTILPGLGHIVIGQAVKGIVVLVIGLFLIAISGGKAILLLSPLLALDAYLLADKLRDGKTIGLWEFF